MIMKRFVRAGLVAAAVLGIALAAKAAGVFPGFPTVPSGAETLFSGIETVPADTQLTQGLVPETVLVTLGQLGQGPLLDSTQTTAAFTIPNNTQFLYLDTGTPATVAITMPAVAIEGQELHITCFVGVATAFSLVANTGQAIKGTIPATCAAGTIFLFRYSTTAPAFNGLTGQIAANTWVRIQ
jgi:hypothetical protein